MNSTAFGKYVIICDSNEIILHDSFYVWKFELEVKSEVKCPLSQEIFYIKVEYHAFSRIYLFTLPQNVDGCYRKLISRELRSCLITA